MTQEQEQEKKNKILDAPFRWVLQEVIREYESRLVEEDNIYFDIWHNNSLKRITLLLENLDEDTRTKRH